MPRASTSREKQREYQRAWRARKREQDVRRRRLAAGVPADGPVGPGEVELAVREELAGLAASQPAVVEIAVALSRILDDPGLRPQHVRPAKALADLLVRARSSAPGRGRLRELRAVGLLEHPKDSTDRMVHRVKPADDGACIEWSGVTL